MVGTLWREGMPRTHGPLTLEDEIIVALRRISRAIDLHSRLLLQRHGLTAPQLAALRAVNRLQPVTLGVVARAVHLSQATVTGIISRLEKRGLIARTRDERDRRTVRVEITPAGGALIRSAPSLLQERFRQELADLQEWERTMILANLQRIASMMAADRIEAAAVFHSGPPGATEDEISAYFEHPALDDERNPLVEEFPDAGQRPAPPSDASADAPSTPVE